VFSYVRGMNKEGEIDKSADDIHSLMVDEGLVGNHCDILIEFHPKGSLTTIDIENRIREIELEGIYEVKLLVHDYMKRMRPNIASQGNDMRIDLGQISDDFSELAKTLRTPVVSVNQVNRQAYDVLVQSGKNKDKTDMGMNASLTMQGESQMITENADVIIATNKEYLSTNDTWYFAFTFLKNRDAKKNMTQDQRYFAHPYEEFNGMRLKEDSGLEVSYSCKKVSDNIEPFDPNDDGNGGGEVRPASQRTMPGKKAVRRSIHELADEFQE